MQQTPSSCLAQTCTTSLPLPTKGSEFCFSHPGSTTPVPMPTLTQSATNKQTPSKSHRITLDTFFYPLFARPKPPFPVCSAMVSLIRQLAPRVRRVGPRERAYGPAPHTVNLAMMVRIATDENQIKTSGTTQPAMSAFLTSVLITVSRKGEKHVRTRLQRHFPRH